MSTFRFKGTDTKISRSAYMVVQLAVVNCSLAHSYEITSYTLTYMLTANLRTKIIVFRGFDSIIILVLRGGIIMFIGDLPERLSRRILVRIILVGRLGVYTIHIYIYIYICIL